MNRKIYRAIILLTICFAPGFIFLAIGREGVWHVYNYKALDYYYKWAVTGDKGPKASSFPKIVYLTLTDETYDYFGQNIRDRNQLARVNDALSHLSPQAVAYDIVFARPGDPTSDRTFRNSLDSLTPVFLPIGCELSEAPASFKWESGIAYEHLRKHHRGLPTETGVPRPLYGVKGILPHDPFADAASGSGDISAAADSDGVYRRLPLLVRIDEKYLPTLSFSVFLNWIGLHFNRVEVNWGSHVNLPAAKSRNLEKDIRIPIDQQARFVIPFVAKMSDDFPEIPIHTFLKTFEDETMRGNLLDCFEGNFVFIADTATGISDLGATPLQKAVPLVTLHAAALNAFFTRTFYQEWSSSSVISIIMFIGFLLGGVSVFRRAWPLYASGPFFLGGLLILTGWEFIHFRLIPIVTVTLSALIIFLGLVIIREMNTSLERKFIRNAFARYMPESVVSELLANPDALRLGGEEREATVLFSDIVGFTTISEKMAPSDLVGLLNEYLTEMTAVIREQGGIIDKFQGDAIMAEFGVPFSFSDHADKAVAAGLKMQQRLETLRSDWTERGLPALCCRIGINTGKMIVGNMGSDDVLDYTVIGDAVNLASRLEGANKRYGTSLMISEYTYHALTSDRFRSRILDIVRVKGKTEAVRVYEIFGWNTNSGDASVDPYFSAYEKAFRAYLSRDFETAESGFKKALSLKPEDPASQDMLRRIKDIPDLLPPDWDGSIQMMTKEG